MLHFARRVALGFWLTMIGAVAAPSPATILPGLQRDGSVLLPNQWSLRPTGRQLVVGDFPLNVALHPNGRHAAVLHCGYSQPELRIIDVKSAQPVSQVSLPEAYYGLTWSPDGQTLFCSGSAAEVVHVFAFADGYLSSHRELRLRPDKEIGVPLGLAPAADGRALYIAEAWAQQVTKIEIASGRVTWRRSLGTPEPKAKSDAESGRVEAVEHPDAAFPYFCLPDEKNHRLFVTLWAKATVLVLDSRSGAEIARWPVGEHPNELVLARDGRLFVAEANLNRVSVLDARNGSVIERLSTTFVPDAPPGAMPNSLALSPDGTTLFVANANNNAIAAFDVSDPKRSQALGFIPVGWFPTSVRVSLDGKTLVVANGKGVVSAANPAGPFPGDVRPRSLQEYVGSLFRGTVSLIDLPASEQRTARFEAWSKQAIATTPLASAFRQRAARPEGNPIPAKVGDVSPIRHVIYVVKENRTYDQIFGDVDAGNGDPRLCLFPETVTPNHHALAREFVLLDNFYADGEVSADGHEWTVGAMASDFVEKTWPQHYGHNARKKFDYPAEGGFPIATPARGYIWDAAARAGVSYRSYGEFVRNSRRADGSALPAIPILRDHIDPQYRAFDMDYPDVKRAARFISELQRFEALGEMPRLQVVRLGNDHTQGTKIGAPTPTAMVADNDLALGQIVEALSRSRFWPTLAIFVLEDDAQNGPDHVDAHRIPAFVISPYTRRGAVDSTLYSTTSMLRTLELILGLEPLSQYDAAAAPMYACFANAPTLAPYAARPAQVDLNARNTKLAWGARRSGRMNLREADRADDIALNEIVWRSVRGANHPMPAPIRAAFFKPHPKSDDDDD